VGETHTAQQKNKTQQQNGGKKSGKCHALPTAKARVWVLCLPLSVFFVVAVAVSASSSASNNNIRFANNRRQQKTNNNKNESGLKMGAQASNKINSQQQQQQHTTRTSEQRSQSTRNCDGCANRRQLGGVCESKKKRKREAERNRLGS